MDNDNDPHRIIFDPQNNQGNEAFVPPDFDEENSSEEEDENEEQWLADLQGIKENNPETTEFEGRGDYYYVQNMADDGWEELGQDIASNTHLEGLILDERALNDLKMSFLCRGLTRSSSIADVSFSNNEISVAGVRSMVPFLQNANNLTALDLDNNNLQSEGFNIMFRALRDSPIEMLHCRGCRIGSIEIDNNHIPKHLEHLSLINNSINADGCLGLAKLLQGGDATLTYLLLNNNEIADDGVEILADALKHNKSLNTLNLLENDGISDRGQVKLLKLVNDVSSIKATLQSNHTLKYVHVERITPSVLESGEEIKTHIDTATEINRNNGSDPEAAGREKVIQTLLHSKTRAVLCRLQGIDRSLFSEIDPLHLPEILSLIAQRHGHGEFYTALSSSIVTLFSTVNRKKCIQQQMEYHAAKAAEHRNKVEELGAELAAIEVAEGNVDRLDSKSNKRRRK